VGVPARDALQQMRIDHLHVRHPANGGAPEFASAIKSIDYK
jgi:hypothetical protein